MMSFPEFSPFEQCLTIHYHSKSIQPSFLVVIFLTGTTKLSNTGKSPLFPLDIITNQKDFLTIHSSPTFGAEILIFA